VSERALALPDPAAASVATLATACRRIYEARDEIIGRLPLAQADEARRRASAIEEYLRGTEAYPDAQRAARVLEMAVGAELGEPKRGKKLFPAGQNLDEHRRHEFRLMYRGRAAIEPYLERDGLSREAALRIARDGHIAMGGLKATTGVEWYTPARYIEAARTVLGGIDLDPASSDLANETVRASHYYTVLDDGLAQPWWGRVWLNPPYGRLTGQFATKLVEEYEAGRVEAGILLINAYGFDAKWFQPLWRYVLCFTDHRIVFTSPDRRTGGPANGNLFVYLGPDERRFADVFRQFGHVVRTWPG
jgi:hypothetical protein